MIEVPLTALLMTLKYQSRSALCSHHDLQARYEVSPQNACKVLAGACSQNSDRWTFPHANAQAKCWDLKRRDHESVDLQWMVAEDWIKPRWLHAPLLKSYFWR